jgi:hypothetical protein
MATTNTMVEMATKPQTIEYALIEVHKETGKNTDGTPLVEVSYTAISGKEKINKAREEGRVKYEQTFEYKEAQNDEGMRLVIRNEKSRARAFTAGVKSSLINPGVKGLMEDTDEDGNLTFEPKEGYYDLDEIINRVAKSTRLSDMEKAILALMPLFPGKSEAELHGILGIIKASGGTVPGIENIPDTVEQEEIQA